MNLTRSGSDFGLQENVSVATVFRIEMEPYKIQYNRNRFPIRKKRPDGTWGCRGCGESIPPKRQPWCSTACSKKYHPAYVMSAVRARDKDVCAFCDFDLKTAMAAWWKEKPDSSKGYIWQDHQAWVNRKPKVNYDHIIPFSEGGMTVLENIRTLCEACHKKRTKDWHRDRCLSRRQQSDLLPLFQET